jgi:predicted transcriptional regulator
MVKQIKKLPDAEFDLLMVVWANDSLITTNLVMEQLGNERNWKAQTVITLMLRLVDRGFLSSEKNGKERTYSPLISKEDYLKFETGNFMKQFHDNSVFNLVTTLYEDKALDDSDISKLLEWAKNRRE